MYSGVDYTMAEYRKVQHSIVQYSRDNTVEYQTSLYPKSVVLSFSVKQSLDCRTGFKQSDSPSPNKCWQGTIKL